MGNVYRAEDLRLPGRLCAIKEVRPEPGASPEIRRQAQSQFLREASLLAQLDHPNLPKVSDFFTEGDQDYLVMDFVPGHDLKELIDEARAAGRLLDATVVLNWAIQIIDAITYLHQQDPPVLHRDIKPANIKLTPDNRIKLVDFGLAKLLASDDTRTITVIQGRGTALYTPLEQYGGESEHTDVRSDIYALGATLYHLLTCQPPPEAKERFLNPSVLRPVHVINKEVSLQVSEAVQWGMEMHPDDRPESMAMFRQVLLGDRRRPGKAELLPAESDLREALKDNSVIAVVALGLFVLAILLTIL
ncbi:MAG: serine/threonine protein kinase [Chloroflexi bacterium]|nr:serine/threonine protein kinase [Chloroflexota bacterium]MCI0646336.1 serine/threonine protein kinase [Chloroflexota bacterium]MCI0726966.1 serine/threonine protein kinase [Chloroflexota bacterium]